MMSFIQDRKGVPRNTKRSPTEDPNCDNISWCANMDKGIPRNEKLQAINSC